MYVRDYSKETARDREINDRITFKLNKETSKKFKEKLADNGTTISEYLKECVQNYINE